MSRPSIFLDDHLAGATADVSLSRRAAAGNRSTAYGEVLNGPAVDPLEPRGA